MARRNDDRWLEMFGLYKEYVEKNFRFPSGSVVVEGQKVGAWFHAQVVAYRDGILDDTRMAMLDGVNPAWKESSEVRAAAERKMVLGSDWRSRVSDGRMPIDVLFQDELRLAACLRARIYDVDAFFHISNHLPQYPSTGVKALFSQENCKAAFELLFPSLNMGCIRLFQDVYQYDGAGDFEKACFFFKEHIPSFCKNVQKVLCSLKEREQKVLRAFYGMDGIVPQNFSRIALDMGVTYSRVHQIAFKGIRKLRHPSRAKEMLTDYDNNGNVLEQFSPDSKALHSWEYDDNGNCIFYQRSNEYWGDGTKLFWEKREYDQNGNMTLSENSRGEWEACAYNANEDLVSSEDSFGAWVKNTYNENGDCVFSERSDGWWEKRVYDAANCLALLEDSEGRAVRFGKNFHGDMNILHMSIDELDLSVRAWHCLHFAGIQTIGDVVSKGRDDLMCIRNMGNKSLEEIESKLAARGLQLMPAFDAVVFAADFKQKDAGLLEMHIAELDLSVRAYNCLRRAGLRTIGDVVQKTPGQLMRVRNMGQKSLDEIVVKLAVFGLQLGLEEEMMEGPSLEDKIADAGKRSDAARESVAAQREKVR